MACPASVAPEGPSPARSSTGPSLAIGGTLAFGVVGEPRSLAPGSRYASDLTRALQEPLGPFEIAGRTPGLEIVYEPTDGSDPQPVLGRLVVRFIQTIDIAIALLSDGRLDAAALPATVNLVERLEARGLNSSVRTGSELVYLDLRGTTLDVASRRALAEWADVASLETAFVRDLGRPVSTLHPSRRSAGSRGPFTESDGTSVAGDGRRISLAAPTGDELLGLLQRALHDDWERHGFEVDVVTIDARTFYGEWAVEHPVDVALRRGESDTLPSDRAAFEAMSLVPLFHMSDVVAWRNGVGGLEASGPRGGPLLGAERWWIDG